MFSSVKSSVVTIILLLVVSLTAVVMGFVLIEYEKLYSDVVEDNLSGLSQNFSQELLPILTSTQSEKAKQISIKDTLMNLDAYKSVFEAKVFGIDTTIIQSYVGPAGKQDILRLNKIDQIDMPLTDDGIKIANGFMFATKRIGESPFALGYIQVVVDLQGPLSASKLSLLSQTLSTILIATAVVITIAILLLNRLLQPLSRLSSFTKQIDSAKHHVNVIAFSDDAIQLLVTSNWPGNVRQLVNVIEQCVALAETTIIPKHLVEQALSANRSTWPNLSDARDAFEHTYLRKLLNMTDGNVTRAAFLAGRNRSDLHKLLKKHELDAANFRQM